ncbi:gamma-glutamyltransferase [Laspinema olomoucense]|uniref:gamma-glutamyltransferase n=1 Tax=Laspinema olomoucense TaxID=3231600 RepID=UPI0021BB60A5|nr:gamma-glutamyltransferase [Laspinema sp. D3c]MCT7994811.1 gamma-glutamyltransferase [Laspinema sp. D3c]
MRQLPPPLKTGLLRLMVASAIAIPLSIVAQMALFKSLDRPFPPLSQGLRVVNAQLSSNSHRAEVPVTEGVAAKNGMVVTASRESSQVGLEILKAGGTAVDAAVAVGYALAVTHPCCGNLGGGGFMLIRQANGEELFLDFRETAPLGSTPEMYLDDAGEVVEGLSQRGYLAVAVPGTVKGLDRALTRYGTLDRAQVMAGAIALARDGFILQPGDIEILNRSVEEFKEQPEVAAIFLKDGTTPYQVGDRLIQPDLAKSLQLIADKGPDAFYTGPIAEKIVTASEQNGGILTLEDFSTYSVTESPPVECSYRGDRVISSPPPGGGTTLCQMLNVLDGYSVAQLNRSEANRLHLMLSAMLYAFADRNTYLGDPAFVDNPSDRLLSADYAAQLRAKIPKNQAIPPEPLFHQTPEPTGTDTTHYSIVDRFGNAVSVTYTINSLFGAMEIAPGTGFFLNNEMDDFTAKPGVPNQFGLVQGTVNSIQPGKRPLSSMSPTILTRNGKLFLVTGSPGGSTIPTTVLQVITHISDRHMTVAQAVSHPRFHYQGLPNRVRTEPLALSPHTVERLSAMGYHIESFPNWGAASSIAVEGDTLWGANDPRRPAGAALGY